MNPILNLHEVAKDTGFFAADDGTQIYFETHGAGEPIVLVYGICCLINHWHHQIAHFAKTYKVIAFDIRGHHLSETPTDKTKLTIRNIADDVRALLDHLKIPQAHLFGHSFGAPILITFGGKYPERVRSLSFINGFAQNPIKGMFGLDVIEPLYHFIEKQYWLAPKMWDQIWKLAINNPLAMFLSGVAGGFNLRLTQFEDIEIYTRGVSQMALPVVLPLFADMMSFNGTDILKKMHLPTLIIAGEKDAVTPMHFQEEMHNLIADSKFVCVPYGSHCTQLDYPDYVNLSLERHIQTHR